MTGCGVHGNSGEQKCKLQWRAYGVRMLNDQVISQNGSYQQLIPKLLHYKHNAQKEPYCGTKNTSIENESPAQMHECTGHNIKLYDDNTYTRKASQGRRWGLLPMVRTESDVKAIILNAEDLKHVQTAMTDIHTNLKYTNTGIERSQRAQKKEWQSELLGTTGSQQWNEFQNCGQNHRFITVVSTHLAPDQERTCRHNPTVRGTIGFLFGKFEKTKFYIIRTYVHAAYRGMKKYAFTSDHKNTSLTVESDEIRLTELHLKYGVDVATPSRDKKITVIWKTPGVTNGAYTIENVFKAPNANATPGNQSGKTRRRVTIRNDTGTFTFINPEVGRTYTHNVAVWCMNAILRALRGNSSRPFVVEIDNTQACARLNTTENDNRQIEEIYAACGFKFRYSDYESVTGDIRRPRGFETKSYIAYKALP